MWAGFVFLNLNFKTLCHVYGGAQNRQTIGLAAQPQQNNIIINKHVQQLWKYLVEKKKKDAMSFLTTRRRHTLQGKNDRK